MTAAIQFVGGDEVVEPFVLKGTDGLIIDLTTVTISVGAGVWWRERLRIPLSVGAGITISNDHPALAASEEDQEPHGTITLTEAQTILIPHGQIASLRLVAIRTLDQITMSTFFESLERIA